jgi:hypothetical protein
MGNFCDCLCLSNEISLTLEQPKLISLFTNEFSRTLSFRFLHNLTLERPELTHVWNDATFFLSVLADIFCYFSSETYLMKESKNQQKISAQKKVSSVQTMLEYKLSSSCLSLLSLKSETAVQCFTISPIELQ